MTKLEHAINEMENNWSLRACYLEQERAQVEVLLAAAKMLPELHGALGSVLNAQEWPTSDKDKKDVRDEAAEVYRRAQELLK